jgi:DNA-binding transcriptional LysR family regulator
MPDEHPLATRPIDLPLRLADLADDAWVTILAGHAAREQFDHACVQAGFTPKIRFQTASYDVAQALVATGYGVALVSRLALTGVRGTVRRDLADPPLYRSIHAITLADTTLTPLVGLFLDLIRDVARDIDTAWAGR